MEKYIDLKYLNLLIEFKIPYEVISHKKDDFLCVEDIEKFKKIKEEIKLLKERYCE